MKSIWKHFYLLPLALSAALVLPSHAQQEGPVPTQTLVAIDAKSAVVPTVSNLTIKVDNRATPLTSVMPVAPSGVQIALLIDDGLRTSVGRELSSLRSFVQSLPAGTEVLIGYMQNGRVVAAQPFTTDHSAAASAIRIPMGSPGASASPYFCVSDFVKKWPGVEDDLNSSMGRAPVRKARFVMMITNGVDPYNGSTSITNQNSPYVDSAVRDAQRAGVPIYSIYFSDAGIRGGQASFSGQSYLQQLADGTGGRAYYNGTGNPVSMAPFLTQFKQAVASTYVATFDAPANKSEVRIKVQTNLPGTKVRSASVVRPGTLVAGK
jgi:hypothetical protein